MQNKNLATCSKSYQFEQDCEYIVNSLFFDAETIPGSDWTANKLKLTSQISAAFGDYCPDFEGYVSYSLNKQAYMTVSLSDEQVEGFYPLDNENTEQ